MQKIKCRRSSIQVVEMYVNSIEVQFMHVATSRSNNKMQIIKSTDFQSTGGCFFYKLGIALCVCVCHNSFAVQVLVLCLLVVLRQAY